MRGVWLIEVRDLANRSEREVSKRVRDLVAGLAQGLLNKCKRLGSQAGPVEKSKGLGGQGGPGPANRSVVDLV